MMIIDWKTAAYTAVLTGSLTAVGMEIYHQEQAPAIAAIHRQKGYDAACHNQDERIHAMESEVKVLQDRLEKTFRLTTEE